MKGVKCVDLLIRLDIFITEEGDGGYEENQHKMYQ